MRAYVFSAGLFALATACGGRILEDSSSAPNKDEATSPPTDPAEETPPPELKNACGRTANDPGISFQQIASNVAAFAVSPCGNIVYETGATLYPEGKKDGGTWSYVGDSAVPRRLPNVAPISSFVFADESHLWDGNELSASVFPGSISIPDGTRKSRPALGGQSVTFFAANNGEVLRGIFGEGSLSIESATRGTLQSMRYAEAALNILGHYQGSRPSGHDWLLVKHSNSFSIVSSEGTRPFPPLPLDGKLGWANSSADGAIVGTASGIVGLDKKTAKWTSTVPRTNIDMFWAPFHSVGDNGRTYLSVGLKGQSSGTFLYLQEGKLRAYDMPSSTQWAGFVDAQSFVYQGARNLFHLVDAFTQTEIDRWTCDYGSLRGARGQIFYEAPVMPYDAPPGQTVPGFYWRKGLKTTRVGDVGMELLADELGNPYSGIFSRGTLVRTKKQTADYFVSPAGEVFPLHKDGATQTVKEIDDRRWLLLVLRGNTLALEIFDTESKELTPIDSASFPKLRSAELFVSSDGQRFVVGERSQQGPSNGSLWIGSIPRP